MDTRTIAVAGAAGFGLWWLGQRRAQALTRPRTATGHPFDLGAFALRDYQRRVAAGGKNPATGTLQATLAVLPKLAAPVIGGLAGILVKALQGGEGTSRAVVTALATRGAEGTVELALSPDVEAIARGFDAADAAAGMGLPPTPGADQAIRRIVDGTGNAAPPDPRATPEGVMHTVPETVAEPGTPSVLVNTEEGARVTLSADQIEAARATITAQEAGTIALPGLTPETIALARETMAAPGLVGAEEAAPGASTLGTGGVEGAVGPGVEGAETAISTGGFLAENAGAILQGAAVVTALASIGFTIMSDKPDLQKALDSAFDTAALSVIIATGGTGWIVSGAIEVVKFAMDLFGFGGGGTKAREAAERSFDAQAAQTVLSGLVSTLTAMPTNIGKASTATLRAAIATGVDVLVMQTWGPASAHFQSNQVERDRAAAGEVKVLATILAMQDELARRGEFLASDPVAWIGQHYGWPGEAATLQSYIRNMMGATDARLALPPFAERAVIVGVPPPGDRLRYFLDAADRLRGGNYRAGPITGLSPAEIHQQASAYAAQLVAESGYPELHAILPFDPSDRGAAYAYAATALNGGHPFALPGMSATGQAILAAQPLPPPADPTPLFPLPGYTTTETSPFVPDPRFPIPGYTTTEASLLATQMIRGGAPASDVLPVLRLVKAYTDPDTGAHVPDLGGWSSAEAWLASILGNQFQGEGFEGWYLPGFF